MQSKTFRLASAAATLFLLAALVFVVVFAIRTGPSRLPVLPPTLTSMPTFTATAAPATAEPAATRPQPTATRPALGAAESVAAGFSFRPPAGYTVQTTDVTATLTGQGENGALRPSFLLSSGAPERFARSSNAHTLEEVFAEFVRFFAAEDDFIAGRSRPMQVDGAAALAADLSSNGTAAPFAGRIVMAQPADERFFLMVGVAPRTVWERETEALFTDVLESVALNEPAGATIPPSAATTAPDAITPDVVTPGAVTPDAATPDRATPEATEEPDAATSEPGPPPVEAAMADTASPLPTPDPSARPEPGWTVYSNGNRVNAVALVGDVIWAATAGGIVRWEPASGEAVKFTSAQGLAVNHFDRVAACPLPGLGIVFGGEFGLQLFDTRMGGWNTLTSANSGMSYDDVADVACDVERQLLVVGYRSHGVELYDAAANRWTAVQRSEGLPSDEVRRVAVAANGNVWAATAAGVAVIAGGRAEPAGESAGGSADEAVSALAADEQEAVWLGGEGVVRRFAGGEWSVFRGEGDSPFPASAVVGLAPAAGGVWLATEAGEVCRLDARRGVCTELFAAEPGMPAAPYGDLRMGPDGAVYVAGADGIGVYGGAEWRRLEMAGQSLAGAAVLALAQDPATGLIWAATDRGVEQFSPVDEERTRRLDAGPDSLPLNDVHTLWPGFVAGIWVGGDGAAYFEDGEWTGYAEGDGLVAGAIRAGAVDGLGRTWLGGAGGLSIWNGQTFFNLTAENGLPGAEISTLIGVRDVVLIGFAGGGLYRYAKNQLRIYTAAGAGLPSDEITALAPLGDAVLVGTERGLARLVGEQAEPVSELGDAAITALATGPDGTVWVGTAGQGVFRFANGVWRRLETGSPLPSPHIAALLVDSYGSLWIGGAQGGLVRFTPPGP